MSGKGGSESGVPHQPPMPAGQPFMGRAPVPFPTGHGFPFPGAPMGAVGSPGDPNQQRLLQIQIRQQQLQLQQLQRQQQQHAQVPPRMSPSHASTAQQHQQQQPHFSSFTTMTTPHINTTQKAAMAVPKAKAPSPAPKRPTPQPPAPEKVRQWLLQCDWKDRTIHASRQLLGGSSVNGFLKATAAAQRIKKQRARQVASVKKRAAADMTAPIAEEKPQSEEEIKREIMNPRTAKKIKMELQQGVNFVKNLYENIQGIMRELDPTGVNVPPPIHRLTPSTGKAKKKASSKSATSASKAKSQAISVQPTTTPVAPTPAFQGSGQRRFRKRKLVMPKLDVNLSEHDASGKRLFSKKEHLYRITEVLRFRTLRAGDYVAARVSSRDLWILARVVKDYPALNMSPDDFLNLTLVSVKLTGDIGHRS